MRDWNKISQNIKFNIIKVSNKIANELKYYTKAVFNVFKFVSEQKKFWEHIYAKSAGKI